jgi:CRP/FNR family transcriptional regulator, cyclic AMP receptor protein
MTIMSGAILSGHEFFHGMPASQLDRLAKIAHYVEVPARQRFFEEGQRADRFWLIETGRVAIDLHVPGRGTVIIESLGPGSVLGWSWLFPPYEWRFGAAAVDPVRAMVLDGRAVRSLCAMDPSMGYDLTRRFAAVMLERLQSTRVRLLDLYAAPMERRP